MMAKSVAPMDQAPRVMPPGTLPIDGEPPRSNAASRRLKNPIDPAPADIEQGRQLYATYCAVCHGSGGRGDGPVAFMLRTPPADLTSRRLVLMKDGSIYGTIRNGTEIMPSYGDALAPLERWRIWGMSVSCRKQAPTGSNALRIRSHVPPPFTRTSIPNSSSPSPASLSCSGFRLMDRDQPRYISLCP
jgi:mono/diheme cytochrome c family protein